MSETSSERETGRLSNLKPVLAFLRPYWPAVVGATLALMVTAGVTLSVGQGLRLLIDRGFATGSAIILEQTIAIFAVLVTLLTAGTFARFYLVSWIGERVSADLRRAVFDHVVHLHPGFFEINGAGEIQTRLTTDTSLLQTVVGSSVSIALRNALMFVGGLILMVVSNPRLSGIVLLCTPLVVAPIVLFGRRVRTLSRASQDTIADVGSFVGEALRSAKTLQAFNHEPVATRRFTDHVETAFQVAVRRIRERALLISLVMLLVLAAIAVMLWVGGQDVLAGRTSPGELAAFIFYAFIVAGSVGAISEVVSDLQRAAGATERLMELLQARSALPAPTAPRALPVPTRGEVALETVTFAYPTRAVTAALSEVSVVVQAGEHVALVGPSGAGKSTLFDLLLRFYDPGAGRVTFDGVDVRDVRPSELRSRIALVSQEPVLFTGTVAHNIRYGRTEASDEAVARAADAAFARDFIEALPDGFDTELGEGGARLSGGQRQRIAIARAVLKDPAVLLLDEATSSLDAQSEHAVQQALARLSQGRTTLVIAHRLATVLNADRTVVLDRGRISGEGTHASLSRDNKLYARLVELQFGVVDADADAATASTGTRVAS